MLRSMSRTAARRSVGTSITLALLALLPVAAIVGLGRSLPRSVDDLDARPQTGGLQQTIALTVAATSDVTLYDSATGAVANGAGEHVFVGRTNNGLRRRAIVRFDMATAIGCAPGSTIESVQLRMVVDRARAGTFTIGVHRAIADWGEGASNAAGQEGNGAPAVPGESTWVHRFFPTDLWSTAGGDFDAVARDTALVAGTGAYTWGSTPGMVADVQTWLDLPSSNFGWLLRGDETLNQTARRFASRQNETVPDRPQLLVVCDAIETTPTPSPTATDTPTTTPSPTLVPTASPSPTVTVPPTVTATPTNTPPASATPLASATALPTPSPSATALPTTTTEPTATITRPNTTPTDLPTTGTATLPPSATATVPNNATDVPTTGTATLPPSATATDMPATGTATIPPSATTEATMEATSTDEPVTATATIAPTSAATPTEELGTPTVVASLTPDATVTATATSALTATATLTDTTTGTPDAPSATPEPSGPGRLWLPIVMRDGVLRPATPTPTTAPDPTDEPTTPTPDGGGDATPTPDATDDPEATGTSESTPAGSPTPDDGTPTDEAPTATDEPQGTETAEATAEPTDEPTAEATQEATAEPTSEATEDPTVEPTDEPTAEPSAVPTDEPTDEPTEEPTDEPTAEPTAEATAEATTEPTATEEPSPLPTGPTPTPSATATMTPTPTPDPAGCVRPLVDGGFESDDAWTFGGARPARFADAPVFGGERSLLAGLLPSEANVRSYSSAWQRMRVPPEASTMRISARLWRAAEEIGSRGDDHQFLRVYDIAPDENGEARRTPVLRVLTEVADDRRWVLHTRQTNVSEYRGRQLWFYTSVFNDGDESRAWMHVDAAEAVFCP